MSNNNATPIPESLKAFFHTSYVTAVEQTIADGSDRQSTHYTSPNVLSIAQHLEAVLENRRSELSPDESPILECFLPALRTSIKNRRLTLSMSNFIAEITEVIMYIALWLNSQKIVAFPLDLKIESRRKGLESELTKILVKSWLNCQDGDLVVSASPPVIRDRYGLRIITANNDEKLLLRITAIIVAILTNPYSEPRKKFFEWRQNSTHKYGGTCIPKEMIEKMLNIFYTIDHVKDYITNPKDSTYQSWQGTLYVDASSPILGGFMFELQTRTWKMHVNTIRGSARHSYYKETEQCGAQDVFSTNFKGGIDFYYGNNDPELDMDGLSHPARILSRHVAPHITEETD